MRKIFAILLSIAICFVALILIVYRIAQPTNFVISNVLTEIDTVNSELREVYVVVNPPIRFACLKAELNTFVSKQMPEKNYRKHRIVFLKEHDNSRIEEYISKKIGFFPSEHVDYFSESITRDDIYEIDLLAIVEWNTNQAGESNLHSYHIYGEPTGAKVK